MKALIQLLAGSDDPALDLAALQMASIEFPQLDPAPFLDMLDSFSRELAAALPPSAGGADYIEAANHLLFDREGFRGDEDDYYHPRNSCLNDVIARRTGIPITLSVIYMEIARRLKRPVTGIGLPGHFLVQYDDGEFSAYVDPFHQGRILTVEQCRKLALHVAHVDIYTVPSSLTPVNKRLILVRMMNNLRNAYFRRSEFDKAIRTHDVLIEATPDAAVEYRQRAALYLQRHRYQAALVDLATYLRLVPTAADRDKVEVQIAELRQYLQTLN